MFCPKCGTPLQDGSVFCPNCGEKLGSSKPKAKFALPNKCEIIMLILATVSFVFLFMNVCGLSIFTSGLFKVNAFLGIIKIFAIIDVCAYFAYLITNFKDLSPIGIDSMMFRGLLKLAFFGIYALVILLMLIAIIAVSYYTSFTVVWLVAAVFAALGLFYTLCPKKLESNLK